MAYALNIFRWKIGKKLEGEIMEKISIFVKVVMLMKWEFV